jgi:secreted trypsin-like serine protease
MKRFTLSVISAIAAQFCLTTAQDNPAFLEKDPLILGGASTDKSTFPYFVEVRSQSLCGGSLIHPSYVLTAGHCVGQPAESFNILLTNGAVEKVSEIIRHPDFNQEAPSNDLALLKLRNPVTNVQTANLNLDSSPQAGDELVIFGMGLTENGQASKQLLSVTKKVLPEATCRNTFAQFNGQEQICIDGFQGKTAAKGDSGSPIVLNGQQVGLVSFGAKSVIGNAPFVGVKLHQFRNFIRTVVGTQLSKVNASAGNVASSDLANAQERINTTISQAPSLSWFPLYLPLISLCLTYIQL